ncbi:hypothetical protein BJ986_001393 [Phycicoccus badiiscoriae]|uniref:Uncharacterized protein n=1 Tax=Pedococcus badiiscoriae TaxID=642776 RepID=A0A852WNE1_9MICO|nr:hypothetical protein [Pedococcus badiiscoriae]NYG06906.1 hypothetical protein [Pedococcus badiiscoriae]
MAVEYQRFQRSALEDHHVESIRSVDILAAQLLTALELETTAIDAAHIHGAQSLAIQGIVPAILKGRLGFDEEVLLTAEDGIVSRPRPDFFYRLGPGEGVIAEVERGGTVNNNHDLKDIWKAHIAPDAQHLFLIVPNSNWKEHGRARERPFLRVSIA